jgi:hypothetical protein
MTQGGGVSGMMWTKMPGDQILGLLTDDFVRSIEITEEIIRYRDPGADLPDCTANPAPATGCDPQCQEQYPIRLVLVGTANDGIFASSDSGQSWQDRSSGLLSFDVRDIFSGRECVVDPEFELRLADNFFLYAGTFGGGVFKGTCAISIINDPFDPTQYKAVLDSISWTELNTGLADRNVRSLAVDPNRTSNLFAGTNDGGVFVTGNGGVLWQPLNPGDTLTNMRVNDIGLVFDPFCGNCTNVLAGTAGGGANRIRILKQ